MIPINVIEILECLYEHIAFGDPKVSFVNLINKSVTHKMKWKKLLGLEMQYIEKLKFVNST